MTLHDIYIDKLQPHPRNAEIYGIEDVSVLAARIFASNWIKPLVVTPEHRIISGHRRWLAAKSLNLETIPAEYRIFTNSEDEIEALLLENENRDKTTEQKTREAMVWEEIEKERARKRQLDLAGTRTTDLQANLPEGHDRGQSRDKAASKVGMKARSYDKSKKVIKKADELKANGKEKEAKQLIQTLNKKSVDKAYKEIAKQEEQVIRNEKANAFKALPQNERYKLFHAEIADLDIGNEDVDVIITDPPYPRDFLSCYEELARLAAFCLKPGGSLLAMAGQSYLPDILALMTPHIRYHWTLAYLTPGGQSAQIFPRNVNPFWKPVLWFVNGDYEGSWIGDVLKSAVNDNDKRFHFWGQSESGMADIVERFSMPNEVILDPFCGGGTTGVVALSLGRRFIGADKERAALDTTVERLEAIACQR